MNKKKLNQLFAAARLETAPAVPPDFAERVLCAARHSGTFAPETASSLWDHLNGWFPRLALAAGAVIILCVAADWGLTAAGMPDVGDGTAQMASQFLFNAEDL